MRLLALLLTFALIAPGAEVIDASANAKISQEAIEKSQVMKHLSVLSDKSGARLTGSPGYEASPLPKFDPGAMPKPAASTD